MRKSFRKKSTVCTGVLCLLILGVCGQAAAALVIAEEYSSPGSADRLVLVCVNNSIYPALIDASLRQYVADLEAERYAVKLVRYSSGTAAELKAYFAQQLPKLKGVLLVGNIPYPVFEIADDFGEGEYASFPCDLFYMQTDTQWLDTDSNNRYDTAAVPIRDAAVRIWVGRLMSAPVRTAQMDEVALLKNYFRKNHEYRTGAFAIPHRGLAFIDDDWEGMSSSLESAYPAVELQEDPVVTNASEYKRKLAEGYEWIHVCVHSSATLHKFKINGAWEATSVTYADVLSIDPAALFYNLFACSNANYAASNNMGGHYTFAKTNGLAAIGSTKTGAMLGFYYFYAPVGTARRLNLGDGFREWFERYGRQNPSWFYGMTVIGDPTLSIDPPVARIESASAQNGMVSCAGSGRVNRGTIQGYRWRSSRDGILSDQATFSTGALSAGEHTIFFQVQDALGRWSTEAASTVTVETGESRYGDVSGDGQVSSYDAALAGRAAVGLMTLSPAQQVNADVTGDMRVTNYDAALIAQRALNLILRFPVEE